MEQRGSSEFQEATTISNWNATNAHGRAHYAAHILTQIQCGEWRQLFQFPHSIHVCFLQSISGEKKGDTKQIASLSAVHTVCAPWIEQQRSIVILSLTLCNVILDKYSMDNQKLAVQHNTVQCTHTHMHPEKYAGQFEIAEKSQAQSRTTLGKIIAHTKWMANLWSTDESTSSKIEFVKV